MKVRLYLIRIFACMFVCCLVTALARAQLISNDKNNRTINVRATYSAKTVADTATVHIGFAAYAPDAQTVYARGSEISNAIIKALTEAGVAKDAIQSDSQEIGETPRYNIPITDQSLKKFEVRQNWAVRTKAADAGKILEIAVHAGADQSGQIDWSVSDEDLLQAQAAAKALVRARTVAVQMAQGIGIHLGGLITASANGFTRQAPVMAAVPRVGAVRVGGGAGLGSGGSVAPLSVPLSIRPHEVQVTAEVYAVFAIQ